MPVTVASGTAAVGSSALLVVIIDGVARRHGIEMTGEEATAYAGFLTFPVHYFGQALALVGQGLLARIERWATMTPPPPVAPAA